MAATSPATKEVELLILAAGGQDQDLTETIDELGLQQVAWLTVEELVFRCDSPVNEHKVFLRLDLVKGSVRATYTLSLLAGRPVTTEEGSGEVACVRLEFPLAEFVRLLYGPGQKHPAGTYRTELLGDEWAAMRATDKNSLRRLMGAIGQATDTVLAALSPRRPSLDRLAARYGSDKWGLIHWFTPHYDYHFRRLRDQPVRILEIGIGGYQDPDAGGSSLLMWKRYFHRGLVFGLDVFAKRGLDAPRLHTVQADQNSPDDLACVAAEHGPFDVVIDDGSHINEHVLTSFDAVFPHVRPGGLYVIEDLWTSYCPGFGGDDHDLTNPATGLGLLKRLIDGIHYEERTKGAAGYAETHTVGLHVYHNLAFIDKGVNAEGGIPPWVPHSFDQLATRA